MSEPPAFSPTITLLAVSRAWESSYAQSLRPLGLTVRKHGLLGHIRASPDISFSELARRSRITVQSVHAAVAGFVEAGLVGDGTAQPGSAATLKITEEGEALLVRAAREVARLDEQFSGEFPDLTAALREVAARKAPSA